MRGHKWKEWIQINGRTKFWVAGYTVKISIRMVQYIARYQYTNIKRVIQMYSGWKFEAWYDFAPYKTVVRYRYTKSCVQCTDHNVWVCRTLHTTFCVSPSHYSFLMCKIVLRFELPHHCSSESRALCLCTVISRWWTWNLYSVSSNSKCSFPLNLVSFHSFVVRYEFKETYFWDDPRN